jgi:MFS family permease
MAGSESHPARFSRNIYAFGATSFFNDTATEMAYWVLPAFLASIGAGPAQLGIIEGIAESIASLGKLYSGDLADRLLRRKPLVVSGYFVANAVKPLLALAGAWWQVLLIRFADRAAKGIRGTARDVMVADSVPKQSLGSAYGLIQALDSAGAIVGPLAALLLLRHVGLRTLFLIAGIPGAICVLVAIFGIREVRRTRGARSVQAESAPGWSSGLSTRFYWILVPVTLFSLANSSDMFLVLRSQNIGIAAHYAPLLGLVFNISYTLMSWPAGHWSDRLPRHWLAAAGYFVFAGVYFLFGLAPSATVIWAAMASYGVFYALTNPVLKALVVDTVTDESRGRALGVYFFATSIATLLASVITGELWKFRGPRVPFLFSAVLAVISALLLLVTMRQAKTSGEVLA